MIERRRSLRALASLPVWLKDGHGGERTCTLDVSAHGVAVGTTRSRAHRQYVELELVLPGGRPLQITAIVARREGQVVGLDFFTLEAEVSHRWRRFVSDLLANRAPEAARSPSHVGPAPWVSATVAPARSHSPPFSRFPAPSTILSAEPPDPASAVRSPPPTPGASGPRSAPPNPIPRSSTKIARRRAIAPAPPSLGVAAAGAPSGPIRGPERPPAAGPTPILASVEPPALMVRPRTVGRLWAFERSELARSVVRLESPIAQVVGNEVDVIVVHPVTAREWTFSGRVVTTRRGRSGRPVVDVGLFGVETATREAFRVFITSGSAQAGSLAPYWTEDSGEERLPSEIVDLDDLDAPAADEPRGDEESTAGLRGLQAEPARSGDQGPQDPHEEPTRAGLQAMADPDAEPTGAALSGLDEEPTGAELEGLEVEPTGSALSGLEAEPTGAELEDLDAAAAGSALSDLDDEPTGAELGGLEVEPTGSALSGLEAEPTGAELEDLDAAAAGSALSDLDDEPTGAELEGLEAEPTGSALSDPDDEPTGAELEGLDLEPTGGTLEPHEFEATDEALQELVIAAPTRPDPAARDQVVSSEIELVAPEAGAGSAEAPPGFEAIAAEPGRSDERAPPIPVEEAGVVALGPPAPPPHPSTPAGPARRRAAVPRADRVTAAYDDQGWSEATGAILLEPRRGSDPIVVPRDRSSGVDPDHWTLDAFIEAASARAEATDSSPRPPATEAPAAGSPRPAAEGIPTAPGRRARRRVSSAWRAEAEADAVARIAEPELPDAVVVAVSPPLAPPPELPIEEEEENLPPFVSAPGSAVLEPGRVSEVFGSVPSDSLFASFFEEAARRPSARPNAGGSHRPGDAVAPSDPNASSETPSGVRSEPAPAIRSEPAAVAEAAPGGGLRVLPHRTASRLERDAMRAIAPPVGRPVVARKAGRPRDPASVVVTPADPELLGEPKGRSPVLGGDAILAAFAEPREAPLEGRSAVSRERAGAHQQVSTAGTNPGLDRDIALARARLVRAPDEAAAAFELAELLRSRRQSETLDEALEVYARVLRLRPNDGAAHARSAELHARLGRYRLALTHLERAEGLEAEVDEDLARWVRKAAQGEAQPRRGLDGDG